MSPTKFDMRHWKKITAIVLILTVIIVGWLVRLRRISRIDFIQDHLYRASRERMVISDFFDIALPREYFIFENLQKIRSLGYEPIWKDYRYILGDPSGGREVDPFLWEGNWLRHARLFVGGNDVTSYLTQGNSDVLNPDILGRAYGDGFNFHLYYLKILGAHQVAVRDQHYIILDKASENDALISFEKIRLRDAAVMYDWWRGSSEAVLKEYGFIAQRRGERIYVPINIETGAELELSAREMTVPRVIEDLNLSLTSYLKDYDTRAEIPEPAMSPASPEVSEKKLLDLYDVRIIWDETAQRYKKAE